MLLIARDAKWWEVALETIERNIATFGRRFFVRGFQKVWEYSGVWFNTNWLGVSALKKPMDLWIYQEIIYETRPKVLIETGSYKGGSALFFATILDLIGEGSVITIDIKDDASRSLSHPRITAIVGSSISDDVIDQVRQIVGTQTAMVSLDSDHHKDHVLKEMELYSEFVTIGNYMVVEDTGIRGPGPGRAVKEFLRHRKDFVRDRKREKFMVTSCRGGFLKRIPTKQ